VSVEGRGVSAVDAPALMTRLEGDRELLAELLELFGTDAEALLASITKGLASSDAPAVHRAAHTLKGAVANFCAPAAVAAAVALESAGRNGDLSDAPALLQRLRREIDAVFAAVGRILASGTTLRNGKPGDDSRP